MSTQRAATTDLLLAGVLAALGAVVTALIDPQMDPTRGIDAGGLVLVVAAALTLAARRSHPLPSTVMVSVATTAYLLLGYSYGWIMISFLIAVYSLARHCPPRRSALVAGITLPVFLTHLFVNQQAITGFLAVVPASAWVVVPYAVGITLRLTRQARDADRARAIAGQVDEERMRLAQDVHDVVGHHLAAIKMQADIALHVMRKNPGQAEHSLRAISGSSGEALGELRTALAELATGETRSPTPGMARLESLWERMRAAGLQVAVSTAGTVRPLPGPVDVAGYRVIQESLTNVLRHGPVPQAQVHITYQEASVRLTVSNPVTPELVATESESGTGMGLVGMRRRVVALGGRFDAVVIDGHFTVTADIPERP